MHRKCVTYLQQNESNSSGITRNFAASHNITYSWPTGKLLTSTIHRICSEALPRCKQPFSAPLCNYSSNFTKSHPQLFLSNPVHKQQTVGKTVPPSRRLVTGHIPGSATSQHKQYCIWLLSNGTCAYLVASIELLQCVAFTATLSKVVISRNLHNIQTWSERDNYTARKCFNGYNCRFSAFCQHKLTQLSAKVRQGAAMSCLWSMLGYRSLTHTFG